MSGILTTVVIHLIRRLVEKYIEKERPIHYVGDLEKTYDKVPKEIFWRCLEVKCVHMAYNREIKDMYEGVKTRIRIVERLKTLSTCDGSTLKISS